MSLVRAPKSVEVGLDLKFFSIKGTWEPNEAERRAAWELYVELITRVATVPLVHGLLREALSSMYNLFVSSREILRRYGPDIAESKPDGQYSFGFICVAMLNFVLRPLLSEWHPALESWEQRRPDGTSRAEHEAAWSEHEALRSELRDVRTVLSRYAAMLATACGVPDLDAVTRPRRHEVHKHEA
jgi:hypothetical protein